MPRRRKDPRDMSEAELKAHIELSLRRQARSEEEMLRYARLAHERFGDEILKRCPFLGITAGGELFIKPKE